MPFSNDIRFPYFVVVAFKGAMRNVPFFNEFNKFLIFLKNSFDWRSMGNLFSMLIVLVYNICQKLTSACVIERDYSDTALTFWSISTEIYWLRASKDQNSKVFLMAYQVNVWGTDYQSCYERQSCKSEKHFFSNKS